MKNFRKKYEGIREEWKSHKENEMDTQEQSEAGDN